ncbi:MAG: DUF503 domain-containing protein [Ardenticatenales bacterium]|nr:DUF503 domain-containing protein [Ardenticatenales bacterium]
MHVCSARVELNLPSRTLKDKRHIIKSLLARARQTFNVAAAEVDLQDVQGAASLGFVTVSPSLEYARGMLERLESWIEQERPDVEIVVVEIDVC